MALSYSFFEDEFLQDGASNKPKEPIWAMDLDDPRNEKLILEWLKGELGYLQEERSECDRKVKRNLALYKGIQYNSQDSRTDRDRNTDNRSKTQKIVVNHIADLAMNRVSRLIKFKPAVAFLPSNDEFSDKNSAKATKSLLDHIWYVQKFQGVKSVEFAKNSSIMGNSYLFILWNPNLGDLHPAYRSMSKKGKVPLLDENGEPKKDEQGNTVYLDQPLRVGDVEYQVVLSTEVWPEDKQRWDDVNYLFRRHVSTPQELRAKFRDKAKDIKESRNGRVYDYRTMELRDAHNEVVWYEFWHKRTDFFDGGRYIAWCDDVILANKDFPFSHRDLPCVRLTDNDNPGELDGESFIERIKGLTSTYNNLTNLILRNQYLVANPKWMYPAGSVNRVSLGNDITLVEYKGPTPPVLVQSNPTPAEVFNFRSQLKEEFQQIAGVFGVSRGEPPPGIKAGVALQFLSEQEQERFNELVLKYNEAIRQIAIMTIAVAGDYYDASDERMIRVLGSENQWRTVFFDAAHLSKDYDVRVQSSSALPETKAARIQTLIELNESFPGQVDPEQLLDMIDIGNSDKFTSIATINVRNAEAENERILRGDADENETAPEPQEDHIIHWKTHLKAVQEYSFKYSTPAEVKEKMIDHIRATEMLLMEEAKINPVIAQAIQTLPKFPIYYRELTYIPPPVPEAPLAPELGLPPEQTPEEALQQVNQFQQEEQLPVNPGGPSVLDQMQSEPAVPQGVGPITPEGA